jgi:hypothetical protein
VKKELPSYISAWCDLTKPWPINRKPKIQYLEPTSPALVEKLLIQVIQEQKTKRSVKHALVQKEIV